MAPKKILELDESWEGFRDQRSFQRPADWKAQEASFLRLRENHDNLPEYMWKARLQETMTTSSFPLLFGDTLNRRLQDAFGTVGTPLDRLFRKDTVDDFDVAKVSRTEDMVQSLPRVTQKGGYKAIEETESEVDLQVFKHGRKVDFSWEMWLRDHLRNTERYPSNLAKSAINTTARIQTGTFIDATGPISTVFLDADNGQAAMSVLPLTITNLATAITAKMSYTSTGEPIPSDAKYLVVGPALAIRGAEILATVTKAWTESAGGASTAHETASVIGQQGLVLIVDKWIPILATTGSYSDTCWYLASDPADIAPASNGVLAGHEEPQIFMKAPDSMFVGGGMASPFGGDFASDNIMYKIRHVAGTAALNARGLWGSYGQAAP